MNRAQAKNEDRVLVLAPTAADRQLTSSILDEAGIACHVCSDLAEMAVELQDSVGVILLTDEALLTSDAVVLVECLKAQPTWSDIPVILLSATGEESPIASWTWEQLGNVTVLERPVRLSTMVTALRSAIRARRRQYELRDQIEELTRGKEALRTADRRKDEFLAMLAHELRNPLAPIRTGLQVIQLSRNDLETTEETLKMMDRQLKQLVRLIDDLLDISRITRGSIELRREPCELGTILSMAIESSRPIIEEAGVELSVTTPRHSIELDADPARLSQVFSNLLTNAAKYTERGGHIWLSADTGQGEVIVSVKDNGIGIRKEMLSRVFEMFTQGDTSERSQGGLGLGLSLVRALVEQHGGFVEAQSDGPAKGSEFTVRLPVASRLEAERHVSIIDAPTFGKSARILVVDDNRDAANALSTMLRLMGNEVRTAYDGLEALATGEVFCPDAVLLDLGMPKISGYETARLMREKHWGKDATIVALTGWGQAEDRRRTSELGFDAHLIKPVDLAGLTDVLSKMIEQPGAAT
jgi:signal transduction histidine kinase/ActR/RegA family two-component response regulator